MQRAPSRRVFLQGAACGAGLGASWLLSAAAPAADGMTYPLFRWKTADEVRRQPPAVWRLVDLINDYRRQRRLPIAALSPRLTAVAVQHVRDLIQKRPDAATGNLHSWSASEHWSGGVYRPDDKSTWPVMWEKPREIAGYDGYGFEIAAAHVDDPAHALREWSASPSHQEVLLSRGVWSKPRWRWKAVGAAFHQGYACAWFGAADDIG